MRVTRALTLLATIALAPIVYANNWWERPPIDDNDYLYGLGEGRSLMLAKQNALADISGKLSTQVSASIERKTRVEGSSYSDVVVRDVKSQLSPANLSQFQVIETKKLKDHTYVLVRLDRQKLAKIWRQSLGDLRKQVTPLLQDPIAGYAQWVKVYNAEPLAKQATSLSLQLSSLGDVTPPEDLRHKLIQKLETRPLKVAVKGPEEKLTKSIKKQLAQSHITYCLTDCDVQVNYQISRHHESLFGQYVSKLTATFSLQHQSILFDSKELITTGSALSGYTDADNYSLDALVREADNAPLFSIFTPIN